LMRTSSIWILAAATTKCALRNTLTMYVIVNIHSLGVATLGSQCPRRRKGGTTDFTCGWTQMVLQTSCLSVCWRQKDTWLSTGDWTVTTPNGEVIIFRREDEGVLQGFPYIKMDANPKGVALLQTTIRQAYEGYSKNEVEGSILSNRHKHGWVIHLIRTCQQW
jgi:hypothetical protein